ncbi:MAG: OmpH family outer membrane protein [Gammaproteobacteria bacterium]
MKSFPLTKSVIALLLAVSAFSAQAETKIGYLDAAALLQNSPQARAVQERLRKAFEPRSKELQAQAEKLQKSTDEFQKNGLLLSEDQRKKKERDLLSGQREFKNAKEAFEEDFRLRQNEELGGLRSKLMEAVDKFGKANGYDLIVTEGVVFASSGIDVTDQVLKVLKELP